MKRMWPRMGLQDHYNDISEKNYKKLKNPKKLYFKNELEITIYRSINNI